MQGSLISVFMPAYNGEAYLQQAIESVIASGVGQLTEVVQDGCNGLLVPPGDVSAMAAAVQRLVGDAALRSRLGRQAREDAVRMPSWEHYLSRLERLFLAVNGGRPISLLSNSSKDADTW